MATKETTAITTTSMVQENDTPGIQYQERYVMESDMVLRNIESNCDSTRIDVDTIWKVNGEDILVRCEVRAPAYTYGEGGLSNEEYLEYDQKIASLYSGEWFDIFIMPQLKLVMNVLYEKDMIEPDLLYEVLFDINAHIFKEIHCSGEDIEDYTIELKFSGSHKGSGWRMNPKLAKYLFK